MTTPVYMPGYTPTFPDVQALTGVLNQFGVLFDHRQGRYRDNKNYQAVWLSTDRVVFIFHEDGRFKEYATGKHDDEGIFQLPEFYLEEPEVEEPEEDPESFPGEEVSDPDSGEDLEENRNPFPTRP